MIELARDGFGGGPIYLRSERRTALHASRFAEIVDASRKLGLSVEIDPLEIARVAALEPREPGSTRTLVRGIRVIPPGTRAHLRPGHFSLERMPAPAARSIANHDDARDAIAFELRRAVTTAIAGERRVAVLTGGGLDSSALLCLAHASGIETNAFAIDFASEGDDRPHLVALAATLGIEPVRLTPSEAELPSNLSADARPLTWPTGAIEATLLARARTWGASRVLCGAGADAWLDGEPAPSLRATTRARLRALVPYSFRSLFSRSRAHAFPAWTTARWRRLARMREDARAAAHHDADPRDADARIEAAFHSEALAFVSELRAQEEALSGIVRLDPYLDREFATAALSLTPALVRGREAVRRGAFREAMRGVLPESIRTRADKASFAAAHRALFRAPLVAASRPYARPRALADFGLVEPRAFEAAFERACSDDAYAEREGARLHAVMATEAFVLGWKT